MTNPPLAYLQEAAGPGGLCTGKPPRDIDRPQPAATASTRRGARITGPSPTSRPPFAIGWRIDSIEPVMVDTATDPDGLPG
jgi:hypothetical protein